MKTKKVRPILVGSKEDIKEGTLIIDSLGKLRICTNNDYHAYNYNKEGFGITSWKAQQLIIISLDSDENIEKGAICLDNKSNVLLTIKTIEGDRIITNEYPNVGLSVKIISKVIAQQSQLSPELINKLIEEYNNGDMKDFEIEMEEETTEWVCQFNRNVEILEPKLTNGFITPIEENNADKEIIEDVFSKKEILYTEEEVDNILNTVLNEILCSQRLQNLNLIKYPNSNKIAVYVNKWLEINKKK